MLLIPHQYNYYLNPFIMNKKALNQLSSRRKFLKLTGLGAVALGLQQIGCKGGTKTSSQPIQGLESVQEKPDTSQVWEPVSDR